MPTTSEAQGLGGDSGSAMFHKEDGAWKLAGLTSRRHTESGQPDVTSTAVYGNLTFAADLSFYASQIYAITAIPEVGSFAFLERLPRSPMHGSCGASPAAKWSKMACRIARINPAP